MSSLLFSRWKSKIFSSLSPSRRRQVHRRGRRTFFESLESRQLLASLDHFVTTEHTDLASAYSPSSGWSLEVHEDIQGAMQTNEALLYVGNNAAAARPAGATWNFTGVAAGESFYIAPQTLTPGRMYLGASAYGVSTSSVVTTNPSAESKGRQSGNSKWVKYGVVDVEHTNPDGTPGDGVFSMWFSGSFGTPTVLASTYDDGISNPNGSGFDATDGLSADDHWWILANGHAHYNFGFSEPGRYEVQLQLSANFTSGGVVTSDPFTIYFSVGSVGQVEFDADSYTVAEDGGSATVNVRRVGGSDGQIEVNYAATEGTATEGEDFELTSGTLVFADGETQKQIVIPILSDDDVEEAETILLSLAAPAPNTIEDYLNDWESKSLIGSIDEASLTILDDDDSEPVEFIAGLTRGHSDIGIAFEDGEWNLHVHVHGEEHEGEEEEEHAGLEYAPAEILIEIGPASETTAPSDSNYSFLGAPGGSSIYVLPTEQDPELPFLGIATEEIEDGVFLNDEITLKLKGVSGPGFFSLWSEDGGGVPTAHMATSDGVTSADFLTLGAGVHAHFNIAFSAAGDYAVTFEAFATLADGVTEVSSGNVTYYFSINQGLAPSITLAETELAYAEQAAAKIVDTTASVTDSDSTNFEGGKLRIDIPLGGQPDDVLSILHQGNGVNQIGVSGNTVTIGVSGGGTVVLGSFYGGTGGEPLVIELTASANASNVTRLMRRIAFQNPSDNPTAEERMVRFVVSDGDGEISDAATRHVVVTPKNDKPVLTTTTPSDIEYAENGAPVIIDAGVTITDADSADFDTGKLTVKITGGQTTDLLGIDTTSGPFSLNTTTKEVSYDGVGVIGVYAGTTSLAVIFNALATPEIAQALARRITFSNSSDAVNSSIRSISFMVTDGDNGTSLAAALDSIDVHGANDAPEITGIATLTTSAKFTENGSPVAIASSGAVVDPDLLDFNGGTLTASLGDTGELADRLALNSVAEPTSGKLNLSGGAIFYSKLVSGVLTNYQIGTVSGGEAGDDLVITFNASATKTEVQAVLRAITFANTSEDPSTSQRAVSFTLTDGDGATSETVVRLVDVIAKNDAPVLTTTTPSGIVYAENGDPVVIDAGVTISDVDSADFDTGVLTVKITGGQTTDLIGIDTTSGPFSVNTATKEVSYDGVGVIGVYAGTTTFTVKFNALATPAIAEALARRITFSNSSDAVNSSTRSISFTVTDGDKGTSLAAALDSVDVHGFNDAPEIAGVSTLIAPAKFPENGSPVAIASSGTVIDPDLLDFDGGTLTASLGATGESSDRLAIKSVAVPASGQIHTVGNAIFYSKSVSGVLNSYQIGTFTGGQGLTDLVLTFNAAATKTEVQAALRAITFTNNSENPITTQRSVTFILTDGDEGESVPVTRLVDVVAKNDAPTVAFFGEDVSWTVGSPATLLTDSAEIGDFDSADFQGGKLTVSLTEGKQTGDKFEIQPDAGGANEGIKVSGNSIRFNGNVIGTFTSTTTLTVTFTTGDATAAAVEALLRRISFRNTLASPVTGDRTVSVTVSDGDGGTSTAVTKKISVSNGMI